MDTNERLLTVRNNIGAAAKRSGRSIDEVELIAVSKTWPMSDIMPFFELGQLNFGENKVQELQDKSPQLPDAKWHMIGKLQRNKVRKVLNLVSAIHSVDSLKLADSINRISEELNLKMNCFLQVHIGDEDSKGGFEKEELLKNYVTLSEMSSIHIQGLMCIPPPVETTDEARKYFSELRVFSEVFKAESGLGSVDLSMGMSHDYEVAIEEGATHVRVGSALFGNRQYQR